MGFVDDFILMNELRATKIAFANLPPYSQQIALREFRQLTSKSESCELERDDFGDGVRSGTSPPRAWSYCKRNT